jgi:hypothetical protein
MRFSHSRNGAYEIVANKGEDKLQLWRPECTWCYIEMNVQAIRCDDVD